MISQDAGPVWTRSQKLTLSPDASAGIVVTELASGALPGQRVVIDDILVSVKADAVITLRSATSKTIFCQVYLMADSPTQITLRNGIGCPDAGEEVELLASVAGNVAVLTQTHLE